MDTYIQYTDFMPHWRHSKHVLYVNKYSKTAPPQYPSCFFAVFNLLNMWTRSGNLQGTCSCGEVRPYGEEISLQKRNYQSLEQRSDSWKGASWKYCKAEVEYLVSTIVENQSLNERSTKKKYDTRQKRSRFWAEDYPLLAERSASSKWSVSSSRVISL